MGEASIPVDLFNPGQVFACLGFLEAADVLLGDAEGGFDWSNDADVRFVLRTPGDENPFSVVLGYIARARVVSVAPPGSRNNTDKWQVPTETLVEDDPFPFPDPESPATLPAIIEEAREGDAAPTARLVIDHWGDVTCRDAVKFWAGSAGYPGAALARDAIDLARGRCRNAASDPFSLSAEQKSSFRFDWRRDYIPIDAGFSLNNHSGSIAAVGFPLVEVFAAFGLRNARPKKLHVLEYRYGVIGAISKSDKTRTLGGDIFFDPCLLRAALGGSNLPFSRRSFRMHLGWPGKEGQARCITTVTEETIR
jgi:CRISPR-associated protein Csb3